MTDYYRMMHLLTILITTTTLCLATNTIITLPGGRIQGGTNKDAHFWLNIPYAKPPVNELRWRPPSYPASMWNGTRDARKQGYACLGPKILHALTDGGGREDCLTLNIYAPLVSPMENALAPVVVFIPGGGFLAGDSSGDGMYDCSKLASRTNTIYVVLQYRLGAFGFLAAPEINPENDDVIARLGLLDQRAGLQFVRDNVHLFQGDKDQVTLWGQSAGGGSVLLHLALEASWDFFHRVVSESPYFAPTGAASLTSESRWTRAKIQANALVSAVGCGGSDTNTTQLGECMRSIPPHTINDALKVNQEMLFLFEAPDANFYPLWSTNQNQRLRPNTPVLMGNNMNESTLLSTMLHPEMLLPTSEKELKDAVVHLWGENRSGMILNHYNEQIDGANNVAFFSAVSDACINCPLRRWRQRLLLEGGAANTSNVYQYVFDAMSMSKLGVQHAAELPLVFNHEYMLLTKEVKELSLQMVEMWNLFDKTGDPNGGVLSNVSWPKSSASNKVMLFRGNRSHVIADPFVRCFVWEE